MIVIGPVSDLFEVGLLAPGIGLFRLAAPKLIQEIVLKTEGKFENAFGVCPARRWGAASGVVG